MKVYSQYETEPLATLPGYTESDYDPAILLRSDWYCVISSKTLSDRSPHSQTHCSPQTHVHYDLEHVRRLLEYDFRSGRAAPFERRYIFKLILPKNVAWPMGPKKNWRFDQWRRTDGVFPIVFVETVVLSREKNLKLTERQLIRGVH